MRCGLFVILVISTGLTACNRGHGGARIAEEKGGQWIHLCRVEVENTKQGSMTRNSGAQAQAKSLDDACSEALARACKSLTGGQDCLNKKRGWKHTTSTGRRRAIE
ncbi:MAG TPA: hypothetical protein EYN06_08805 [Myxococcales bacterium]|nr:hypothetical protein [Myxococcales bacterium]HIN86565.1 hypothetical protein [Myxococcales bacterium]